MITFWQRSESSSGYKKIPFYSMMKFKIKGRIVVKLLHGCIKIHWQMSAP